MAEPPAACGQRLLVNVVDQRALTSHPRPFACIPSETGYRDVSYLAFANAINRAALWLGDVSDPEETLVYMGPGDLRYQIFILAAAKSSNVLFLPSPRNSSQDLEFLGREAGATKLLTCTHKIAGFEVIQLPSLDTLLDPQPVRWIRYTKSFEEVRFQPFVQIHSSGSTGTPKLITLKHGNFCAVDAMQTIGGNEIHDRLGNMRLACPFPLFHVGGIIYALTMPIMLDSTVILPPAGPVNAEIVNDMHVRGQAEFSVLPPSLIIDLAKQPAFLENIRRLRGVSFAGGPLPEPVGKQIVEHTQIIAGWGASEYQSCPQLRKDKEDWPFFKFNEKEGGIEFREQEDGLYEMVHVRYPELDHVQPIFITYPELSEFHTKDLFAPHPSKTGLWKYVSRADDIIVFSNGEKLNPTTMENTIISSPEVKGCLIIGQGRFQAVCLVEPRDSDMEKTHLVEMIWPYISRANESTAQHGRISRDAIFFTSSDKPLPRAAKGTIQRSRTNQLYDEETDALYRELEVPRASNFGVARIDFQSLSSLEASIRSFLMGETGMGDFGYHDDFFAHGMDSLQLVNLVRAINTARPDFATSNKEVYDHPSVSELARHLWSGVASTTHENQLQYDSDDEEMISAWVAMDDIFNNFTSEINPRAGKARYMGLRSNDFGPVVQPDGGRVAWLQVLASFLINLNNWGLVNAFGVFQAYYADTHLQDYSVYSLSWIGTVQGALLLIVGVVSGPLFDSGYFKVLTVGASAGLVFALMMLSLSTLYYQLFLTQGILMGICSGLLYIPSVAVLPVYFKHRRGLALGLGTSGASVGGILYPVVFQRLLSQVGFPWATRIIGFMALLTLGVACVVVKPLGPRQRRQLIDRAAFQDRAYIFFMVSALFLFAGLLVPFFLGPDFSSLPSIHTDDAANYVLAILNLGQLFGRILPAISSDFNHQFVGAELMLFGAELCAAILGFAWIGVKSLGAFMVWSLVYGFATGMATTLPALVLPHICTNLAVYGTRLGMLYACAGVGFLVSTPIAASVDKLTGGFSGAQIWTGACCLAAALVFAVVGWEARKQRLLYESGKKRTPLRRRRIKRARI